MIPKIIHYVWIGNKEKSQDLLNRIEAWKEILPDWKIMEWDNQSIQNLRNKYLSEALTAKKWAHASDYIRLYALKKYGGVYLDTDVDIKKSLLPLLKYDFFIGSEKYKKNKHIGTAVIGSIRNSTYIQSLLNVYKNIPFIRSDGTYDTTPNTDRLVPTLKKCGFPSVYTEKKPIFSPDQKGVILPIGLLSLETKDSFAVHRFNGSWFEPYKYKNKITLPWFKDTKLIIRKCVKEQDITIPAKENEKVLISFSKNKKVTYQLIQVFSKITLSHYIRNND